jgi:hypothetical protein
MTGTQGGCTIGVGFPRLPVKTIYDGSTFRDRSHFVMFRPSGLLASQIVPTAVAHRHRAAEAFTSDPARLAELVSAIKQAQTAR